MAAGMLIFVTFFFTRLQDWNIEFRGLHIAAFAEKVKHKKLLAVLSSPRGKLSLQMSLDSGVVVGVAAVTILEQADVNKTHELVGVLLERCPEVLALQASPFTTLHLRDASAAR